MRLHSLLLLLLLSIVLHSNSSKTLMKPGPECVKTCGNLTVPYPFGIQENCYLDQSYMVSCNTTSGRARIRDMTVDVVNISLDGHLRVISPVARICYNQTTIVLSEDPSVNLSRFPISLARNKIMTIGCDTRGNIKIGQIYQAGCLTMPGSCNRVIGSCSGNIGCCQATIEPSDLTRFRFHVESNSGNVGKTGFNNCSYSFIVEDGVYNFLLIDPYNLKKKDLESYEMLLDWTVGNESCQEAQKNTSSYLCRDNSKCFDANNGPGYTCTCSDGYEGNPYLENGCIDIDECKDARLNNCLHICNNIPGSYTCHCPKGYSGDGLKDGTRCAKNTSTMNKVGVYMGSSIGMIVTSITMYLSYCLLKHRRITKQKEQNFIRNGGKIFEKLISECEESKQIVKIFTEDELKNATKNFSLENIVGQGGFGTVYKGILVDNTIVAIKKSKGIDLNQVKQFVNEVVFLSQINYTNIVKLVGCCLETDVPLLAYEYVVNETLHHHLHGKPPRSLSWRLRLKIAVETAGALAYMHSTTQIIHRDIKSSNILLTDDYTAKVSDFGISRFIPMDQTHIQTLVHGTLGYIDPEYFRSGILTEKSDVYSFGMVLVELLTGRKVFAHDGTESDLGLAMFFVSSLERGSLMQILDHQVKKDGIDENVKCVAKLAKECIELEGKKRPNMKTVKEELDRIRQSYIKISSREP